MPLLKFKVGTTEFEYVGTQSEIEAFVRGIISRPLDVSAPSNTVISEKPPITYSGTSLEEASKEVQTNDLPPLPQDDDVKTYIKNKPNYQHTVSELQEYFFGKTFKSRGPTRFTYHKFSRQLRNVRQEIEEEEGGEFQDALVAGGVKQFTFKKKKMPELRGLSVVM